MEPKAALVHIGTHKTGSSAFQKWAHANRSALARTCDFHYYDGLLDENHAELPTLCLRDERMTPTRCTMPEWRDDAWRGRAIAHVRSQVARPSENLVISAEGLSYVRHPDEVERLKELLSPRRVSIVVVLREPEPFLKSYRAQMKSMGFAPSRDPTSFAYTRRGSWLTDYRALIDVYREGLPAAVTVLSYESSMRQHGSIIPALVAALGFDPSGTPAWRGFTANVTPPRRSTVDRVVSRLRQPFAG